MISIYLKDHDLCILPKSDSSNIERPDFIKKQEIKGRTYYKSLPINFHRLLPLDPELRFSKSSIVSRATSSPILYNGA